MKRLMFLIISAAILTLSLCACKNSGSTDSAASYTEDAYSLNQSADSDYTDSDSLISEPISEADASLVTEMNSQEASANTEMDAESVPVGELTESQPMPRESPNNENEENKTVKTLKMKINGASVAIAWEDNETVQALKKLAEDGEITVQMSMYGGFEQVGSLGTTLPRNDKQTTTSAGDIVLYSGDSIVVFYGSNSWAYTRLGKISNKTQAELKDLLGSGDATLTLTVD